MNILPKKSWHVRNKDNVAKVRKDEEEARNEEKKRQLQIALAEQEARTELLRKKAKKSLSNEQSNSLVLFKEDKLKPINFFQEIGPDGKPYSVSSKNQEHEKEKQEEKEKAEKKIGLLTYLGQSAVETLPDDQRPWYFKPPNRSNLSETKSIKSETAEDKKKSALDPMAEMKEHLKKKKKHKHSHKKHKSKNSSHSSHLSSEDKLAKLRKDRLEREAKEKQRSIQLLQKHYGSSATDDVQDNSSHFVPKYNNQFNPRLARNNK